MNLEAIPKNLHHLVPIVEKWGISDDGYREDLVSNAPKSQLNELVASFSDKDAYNLDEWLIDPLEMKKVSEEYEKFSSFYKAFEFAVYVLELKDEEGD